MAPGRKRGAARKRSANAAGSAREPGSEIASEPGSAAAPDLGAADVGSAAAPSPEDVERALDALGAAAAGGGGGFGSGDAGGAALGADDLSGDLDEDDIREMLGMFAWAFFRLLPPKVGGGTISEEESRFLGKVYSRALWPYLQGKMAPLTVALVITGEMLLKRAMLNRAAAALGAASKGDADAKG